MGGFLRKPRKPASDAVMDSIVLCDGRGRWDDDPYFAESNNGRFIFNVGDEYGVDWDDEDDNQWPEPVCNTFCLDIIDTVLSKRTRIVTIGDFFNLGSAVYGIYALNDATIVLVDYERDSRTLRQRLVTIDHERKKASCTFYRGYSVNLEGSGLNIMCIGEGVMCIEGRAGGRSSGFLFPTNPLSTESHTSLSAIYTKAYTRIPPQSFLSNPFFISKTEIGFFEVTTGEVKWAELKRILVCDFVSGTVGWRNATAPFSFGTQLMARLCELNQRSLNEVTVQAEFQRKEYKYKRWLMLDTQTLRWHTIMVRDQRCHHHPAVLDFTVQSFRSGIFYASLVEVVGSSRVIGNSPMHVDGTTRIDLIRHPMRVPSLQYLARIAVQKHEMELEDFAQLLS